MMRLFAICLCCLILNNASAVEPKIQFRLGTSLIELFNVKLRAAYENKPLKTYNKVFAKQNTLDTEFIRLVDEKFTITKDQINRLKQISRKSLWSANNWHPYCWQRQVEYEIFMGIVREISHSVIPSALEELGLKREISMPVIHYRLSDVPFCRSTTHHLQYYAFYDIALEKLKNQGIDVSEILLLYTFHHGFYRGLKVPYPKFLNANEQYLNDFVQYLEDKGHKVNIQSNSTLDDFATMVFAPALIGSESIFCIFSGLANKQLFISPSIGKEYGNRFRTLNISSFMLPFEPLLHSSVKNYYHSADVFAKLRQKPKIIK